jgi:glucose-1-phosphate adenylyltransferase
MDDLIAIVLGGGRGTRLSPLTKYRSKPAVPIAASYRLVDVAVSNCIHANLRRIFVVTQYQSESLNRHIANTYDFDAFSSGFVDILAAEQTDDRSDWFRGTADAVKKCMKHVGRERWGAVAILAGDQLYRMDLQEMMAVHRSSKADVTVATKVVSADLTSGFGIMKIDPTGRIVHFEEKPDASRLSGLASPIAGNSEPGYLASMGIYIFNRKPLEHALEGDEGIDFGKHVIPDMLQKSRVQAYLYDGYWEDVGTIRSYFEANLALTTTSPPFSFYHPKRPIYTRRRFLAPTIIHDCRVNDALVSEGCFLKQADLERAVVGVRTRIAAGARLRNTLVLGADYYDDSAADPRVAGSLDIPLGIGEGCHIEGAIIDKNVRIGKNVRIRSAEGREDGDETYCSVRDGIVIVPKGMVIPDGTII